MRSAAGGSGPTRQGFFTQKVLAKRCMQERPLLLQLEAFVVLSPLRRGPWGY